MSRNRKPHNKPSAAPAEGEASGADQGPGERLQKVLAAAGVGSRRDCEELIREGRIEIDRKVITELGTRVDPLRHEIRVDGEALRQPKRLYFAVNKPDGVVTTNFDPSGRPRVIDLVPTEERVFAVGRLDRSSEGLILVTNDGEFANRLTHPRYGVEKTYLVRVAGTPGQAELTRLRRGVHLSDGLARVQTIIAKKRHKQSSDLIIVLNEGRNREIRRILARVGHKVLRLKRIAVGTIKLGTLPVGSWRKLSSEEVELLMRTAKEKRRESRGKKRGKSPASAEGSSQGAKPVKGKRPESSYVQQQALMAEPLSLDDLLSDDMDDGGMIDDGGGNYDLTGADFGPSGGQAGKAGEVGDVIDYGDEEEGDEEEAGEETRRSDKKPLSRESRETIGRDSGQGSKFKFKKKGADPSHGSGGKPAKKRFGKGTKKSGPPEGARSRSGKPAARGPSGAPARGTRGGARPGSRPGSAKPSGGGPAGKPQGGKPSSGRPVGGKPGGGKPAGGKPFGRKKFGKPGGKPPRRGPR